MVEVLKVTQRKNANGLDYTTYDVDCPAIGEAVSTKACKECDHCRVFLGDSVKCSYKKDKERADKPFIHAAYIL
jgi:hypothetical protein